MRYLQIISKIIDIFLIFHIKGHTMKKLSLKKLNRMGKTVIIKLSKIGITNQNDLRAIGASKAYKFMSKFFPNEHLNITTYLYEVESALKDRSISDDEKKELRMQAGLS